MIYSKTAVNSSRWRHNDYVRAGRLMRVERDEIEAWLRLPVTIWLMETISGRLATDAKAFRGADSWDQVNRLKGRAEVMEYLSNPVNLWRMDQ